MNLRELGIGVLAVVVGALVGNAMSGSYLDGRLSACKDMTAVLNQSLPLQLECSIEKGDVYISSPYQPGVKVSIDGKKVLGQ